MATDISFIHSVMPVDGYGLGPLPASWIIMHKTKMQSLPSETPGRGQQTRGQVVHWESEAMRGWSLWQLGHSSLS